MLPEFTSHAKQSKTRTVRYLDGSVGPELQSRDVMLVFLIAISCEYSGSNPSVFNQLNRSLLKILFLTDSGTDVRAYHVWNKFVTGLERETVPLPNLDDVISQLRSQLTKLTESHVTEVMDFFEEVETLICSRSPKHPVPVSPDSIFGLFLRRSVLQFKNQKFSQLTDLYKQFKIEVEVIFNPHDDVTLPDHSPSQTLTPSLLSLMDSGDFYAGVREIYSRGVVEHKINLLELSPQDDPPTLHTTADICQTSLMMAHLYHRYGFNKMALRFLKEGIRLAHELGLKEISKNSADWLKVYLKLSNQPPTIIEDGNYYLETLLEQRVHRHAAEWKDKQGANKAVNWTSELPKTTTTKCLCWDKFGKVDMTCLASQLVLSTLEGPGGKWDSLLGHEKARGCNAVIFIARMLCSRGSYQPALAILDKLRTLCPLNTWLYAQTSEAMLDIESEKCLLAGELKEASRLIVLLSAFCHILAKLKEVEMLLVRSQAQEAYDEITKLSNTRRMKTQVHMRYLLDVGQAFLQSSSPSLALTPLSQCLRLSQAAKATHFSSAALVQMSHCFLLIDKPKFAIGLLRAKRLEIMECGSVVTRGSAHFTMAQAILLDTGEVLSEDARQETIDLLHLSLTDFTECGAVLKQLDVLAVLSRLYTLLGDSFSGQQQQVTDQLLRLYRTTEILDK